MTTLSGSVLVVDDEVLIAVALSETLKEMGMEVCGIAVTARKAIDLALRHRPDLVLMDFRLKGTEDGVHAACAIHASVGCPVIFITGSREPETMRRIKEGHPAAVLIKPILPYQLKIVIESVIAA